MCLEKTKQMQGFNGLQSIAGRKRGNRLVRKDCIRNNTCSGVSSVFSFNKLMATFLKKKEKNVEVGIYGSFPVSRYVPCTTFTIVPD